MKSWIKSPLSENHRAVLKGKLQVNQITNCYMKELNLDVAPYFKKNEVFLYECELTGYRFYYPFHSIGDSKFYENLEVFDWYYMPWKWEHEKVLEKLQGNEKILEIGSGGLGFIKKMQSQCFNITGLELNSKSVAKARDLKLKVFNESVQEHSIKNSQTYDVVCCFQVLEHIAEVRSFLETSIECLKTGGHLVISVPNNNSFLGVDKNNSLNLPPHHMGLWDKTSLKNLPLVFPELKLESIMLEPLQDYHKNYFEDVMISYYSRKLKVQNPIMARLTSLAVQKLHFLFSRNLKSFTIQAVYKKRVNEASKPRMR